MNTTGSYNTASGTNALYANTTGVNNTASGTNALRFNTTGNSNTASGYQALLALSAGSNNTALGWGAGALLTSGSNNIYVGHPGVASESATLRLGDVQTRAFIKRMVGTVMSGSPVVISSTGQLGVSVSSARYKQDIHPLTTQSGKVQALRPVTYRYKAEPEGPLQYGLIAEEVAQVYPELVTRDAEGVIEGVRYEALTPLLLKEVQDQHRQMATQAQQQAAQTQQMQMMLQQMAELKAQNDSLRAAVARLQGTETALTAASSLR